MATKKKEELEVPQDLKETPRQRRLDGRIILIGSIFLALVIFGAIAYFSRTKTPAPKSASQTLTVSPTPNPIDTSTWQTFSNPYFSIKCPQDCNVSPERSDPNIDISQVKSYDLTYKTLGTIFDILPNSENLNIDDWWKENSNNYSVMSWQAKNILVNRIPSLHINLGTSEYYFIPDGSNVIQIFSHDPYQVYSYSDLVKTIVNTITMR